MHTTPVGTASAVSVGADGFETGVAVGAESDVWLPLIRRGAWLAAVLGGVASGFSPAFDAPFQRNRIRAASASVAASGRAITEIIPTIKKNLTVA